MSEYRKAMCIELHDANLALVAAGAEYGVLGPVGRTQWPDKPAYRINLGELAMLAEMFGLGVAEKVGIPRTSDQVSGEVGTRERLNCVDLPLYKTHNDEESKPGGTKITCLECEVVAANLVNIRTTRTFEGLDETVVETLIYSGAFTLWWSE